MNLVIVDHKFHYEIENLIRVFFPNEKINVTSEPAEDERQIITKLNKRNGEAEIEVSYNIGQKSRIDCALFKEAFKIADESSDSFYERKMAIMLFELLKTYTGYVPPWGILTGVRPAKLMTKLSASWGKKLRLNILLKNSRSAVKKQSLLLWLQEQKRKYYLAQSLNRSVFTFQFRFAQQDAAIVRLFLIQMKAQKGLCRNTLSFCAKKLSIRAKLRMNSA